MPFKDIEKKKEYSKNYYKKNKLKNKDKAKESHRLYYLKNKEKIKIYAENNKERLLKYRKEYRLKNKDRIKEYTLKNKDKINKTYKLYHLNNPHISKNKTSKRRSAKLKAIPKFANLDKIKEIYKNCPKGYHVDHIIPLQGENVCGLHVEWNLQYLTAYDNKSKSNKLII
jgi:hypothetical protein